jgi:alpha-tubulin suppressor-like RCC1 family protein
MKTIRFIMLFFTSLTLMLNISGKGTVQAQSEPPFVPEGNGGAVKISANIHHTCMVTQDGAVKCWGYNYDGQLGTGDTVYRSSPSPVSGLSSGVIDVATGQLFSCALVSNGKVYCWGDNVHGELGDGTNNSSLTPVEVSGLPGPATAITAGVAHACALVGTNAYCWGANWSGQLGNGDAAKANQNHAVLVGSVSFNSLTAIAAGNGHTCAIAAGNVWCWGQGGLLGNGSSSVSVIPVSVMNLPQGITQLVVGAAHSCILTSNGGAYCWGNNTNGQIGIGSTTSLLTPAQVTGLGSGVSKLFIGSSKSCAVMADRSVKCWGQNRFGELGDDTMADQTSPVLVTGMPGVPQQIAFGDSYSCMLLLDGGIQCRGSKSYGALGNGDPAQRDTPQDVPALSSGVTRVSAGVDFGGNALACAVVNSGAKCWGANSYGQLGNGTQTAAYAPVDVSGLSSGVTQVSAGGSIACALVNGGVKCWGKNNYGQLGNNSTTDSLTPVDVSGLTSGVSAISAGVDHVCAIKTDHSLWCWGNNQLYQLGNTGASSLIPVQVTFGSVANVNSVSAGYRLTCANISFTSPASDKIYCWGNNANGQLGRGTTSPKELPASINTSGFSITSDSGVTAGHYHACVIAVGGAYCWGNNGFNQLGNNSTTDSSTPVKVFNLSTPVSRLSAGRYTTCALVSGGAYCWGSNSSGTVGNGSTENQSSAREVSGLSSGVVDIVTGGATSFAILDTGQVKAWGSNNYGQLGTGNPPVSPSWVWVTGYERFRLFLPAINK